MNDIDRDPHQEPGHDPGHNDDSDKAAMAISLRLENLLVGQNLRGMRTVQAVLDPGYLLRAAKLLLNSGPRVLIATGFPVLHTFETDGPVGAIALCQVLQKMKYEPLLLCEAALASALFNRYPVQTLTIGDSSETLTEALLAQQPDILLCIERPGVASDGHYYNMRAEDISNRVAGLDAFVAQELCPTIAIGDGGNELGMGNALSAVEELDIKPAVSGCTELIPADVSNWGALGLIAMLGWLQQKDLLATVKPLEILDYLSKRGSLDGVTRRNELTEDGLPGKVGVALLAEMRQLTEFC
ncbi:glutamate cyclase domain-containing protein [Pseudomaricurvus alcaniphilus]|uniref:glutamate cyclase domain-containing protein n=1 Tax=Pseudomaricurvus alcaniphilus TaxID=1166482 RepID=UPI001FB598DB|nr:glutamate cyclase domain-containing protein [Pseudomaricurvus alcaniphilus]